MLLRIRGRYVSVDPDGYPFSVVAQPFDIYKDSPNLHTGRELVALFFSIFCRVHTHTRERLFSPGMDVVSEVPDLMCRHIA